jgi:hypothetical protein
MRVSGALISNGAPCDYLFRLLESLKYHPDMRRIVLDGIHSE